MTWVWFWPETSRNMCRHMTWELSMSMIRKNQMCVDIFGRLWPSHVFKHHCRTRVKPRKTRFCCLRHTHLNSVLGNALDEMTVNIVNLCQPGTLRNSTSTNKRHLVAYPSEKWWSSSVGVMTFPTEWTVIKIIFQTTNQIAPIEIIWDPMWIHQSQSSRFESHRFDSGPNQWRLQVATQKPGRVETIEIRCFSRGKWSANGGFHMV